MKKIGYLLHRFPRVTDTFIMREIRALRRAGTNIQIVSIWKPYATETNSEVSEEWFKQTSFLLPRSVFSVVKDLCGCIVSSPVRFAGAMQLAWITADPGLRGLLYQAFYLTEAALAAEELKRNEVAHIHNHFGDHSGIITMLAAKLADVTYSISFHGPHVFFGGRYARIKEKVSHAQFIRCISYFCRSQVMLFSERADPSRLKIVHCGLDLSEDRFRLPREKVKTIYCAARLAPEKGFEFLLQAVRILNERNYDLLLRLAGDGPCRADLERLAQALGIEDRVQFLGYIDEESNVQELCAADLFVLPSLAEGLPISATEAMAVGVPVIATNIAGTSELVEDGRTGLLVRPSDSQALADAIIRIIDDFDFRLRVAELGRKKVMEEFDVERETAKLKCYLEESI